MSYRFEKIDEEISHRAGFLSLATVRYRGSDGAVIEREYVRHPGAVTVIPLCNDDTVLALWQFRAALGREVLEICAGKRDVAGEAPATTAERELAEELGLAARITVPLGVLVNSPGFTDEETHVFAAFGLSLISRDPQGIEESSMRPSRFSLERFSTLVGAGALHDAKTIASLAMLQSFLLSEPGRQLRSDAGEDSFSSSEFVLS